MLEITFLVHGLPAPRHVGGSILGVRMTRKRGELLTISSIAIRDDCTFSEVEHRSAMRRR